MTTIRTSFLVFLSSVPSAALTNQRSDEEPEHTFVKENQVESNFTDSSADDSDDYVPIAIANTAIYFVLLLVGFLIMYAHIMRPRWFRWCGHAENSEPEILPTSNDIPPRSKSARKRELLANFKRLTLLTVLDEADFKDVTIGEGSAHTVSLPSEDDETEVKKVEVNKPTDIETGVTFTPTCGYRRRGSDALLKLKGGQVQNLCAICLDSYEPGDTIVRSNNPKCPHAYHVDCIVPYFSSPKVRDGDTPCPFCRQTFCIVEEEPEAEEEGSSNTHADR